MTDNESPQSVQQSLVNPLEIARQQAEGLVRNVAAQTNLAIQNRIDELLNLQANITQSANALMHYVGEYTDRCNDALETSKQIQREIETMASPFAKRPPATLTQPEEPQS